MKHRCAEALHLLAENTDLTIEYMTAYQDWHKGSFYVIDKADRDLSINIRIKDGEQIIWETNRRKEL